MKTTLSNLNTHVCSEVLPYIAVIKEAMSRFTHLDKFHLKFSSSSFVIHVNLLHP